MLSIGIASKKYFPLKFIGDPFSIIKVPLLTPLIAISLAIVPIAPPPGANVL